MDTEVGLTRRLDAEFDQHLADMKPYVLNLTHKSERQRCALWIKKFCEPHGPGVTGRKNRNMYAQLLLIMLRRGNLEGPFTQRPEGGQLPPLPTYMSIYFDEPGFGHDLRDKENEFPEWVDDLGTSSLSRSDFQGSLRGSLGQGSLRGSLGQGSLRGSLGEPRAASTLRTSVPEDKYGILSPRSRRRTATSLGLDRHGDRFMPSPSRPRTISSRVTFDPQKVSSEFSSDDEMTPDVDYKPRSRSPNLGRSSPISSPPRSSRKGDGADTNLWRPLSSNFQGSSSFKDERSLSKMHEQELNMKVKMMEAKSHEEKLRMQQKHDSAVQKILDRKNSEIEDMKSHYRTKNNELEDKVNKLEKKVSSLVREAAMVRENKDKQITELKKMAQESNQSKVNEYEKKLHDAVADFEQEKFDLQKQHTRNIQDLLDDTNTRLQKMEHEYSQQTTSMAAVIKDLEGRLHQLTQEVERTKAAQNSLERIKIELESQLERMHTEVTDWQSKYSVLDAEHQRSLEQHDHDIRIYRQKTETSVERLQQEHSMISAQLSDTIVELEDNLSVQKQRLEDSVSERQRQVRELEQGYKQDKMQTDHLHDKKVKSLKKELDQMETDYKKKIRKLEETISSKDEGVRRLADENRQQASQAEQALDQFKGQVEKNSSRMFEDMKKQMEKVEADLTRSKQLREKQKMEFEKQIAEERQKHEHSIVEVKIATEQNKAKNLQDFHLEKEALLSDHDREIDNIRDNLRRELFDAESRAKERQDKDAQAINEMEQQLRQLREEVVQANQLRKQQLLELGLLRDEEKHKMHREMEAQTSRLNSQMEQQRLDIQKLHSAEMEKMLEKTNARLKEIEKEYTLRSQKSTETMIELQRTIEELKEDRNRLIEVSERKVTDVFSKQEQEKKSLKRQHSSTILNLQQDCEAHKNKVRTLDRRLQQHQADFDEKVNELEYQHEQKMKGLMPIAIRNALEDTISSLKSQVNALQQRAMMLQEELDVKNRLNTSLSAPSLSPIKL